MGQHGEYRFARCALDAPDGETTQAETGIMGVACHVATLTAAGFVEELEAHREEEGKDELDKRVWGVEERQVGRLIVKVDGDGPVVACRFGGLSHGSPPVQMARRTEETW